MKLFLVAEGDFSNDFHRLFYVPATDDFPDLSEAFQTLFRLNDSLTSDVVYFSNEVRELFWLPMCETMTDWSDDLNMLFRIAMGKYLKEKEI